MILVTVGAQMPFDRLVRAVDEWAAAARRSADVFALIGKGGWKPDHIPSAEFLDPPVFLDRVRQADLIVAHAGTGSILQALEHGRPILVMPRRAALKETRNDHQVATAERFLEQGRVQVAWDETEVAAKIEMMLAAPTAAPRIGAQASAGLIEAVRRFIEQETNP